MQLFISKSEVSSSHWDGQLLSVTLLKVQSCLVQLWEDDTSPESVGRQKPNQKPWFKLYR